MGLFQGGSVSSGGTDTLTGINTGPYTYMQFINDDSSNEANVTINGTAVPIPAGKTVTIRTSTGQGQNVTTLEAGAAGVLYYYLSI